MLASPLHNKLLQHAPELFQSIEKIIDEPNLAKDHLDKTLASLSLEFDQIIFLNGTIYQKILKRLYNKEYDPRLLNYIIENLVHQGAAIRLETISGVVTALLREQTISLRNFGILPFICFGRPYIINHCKKVVKNIIVQSRSGEENTGTAFLGTLDKHKYLFTCKHNIMENDGSARRVLSIGGENGISGYGAPIVLECIDLCLFPVKTTARDVLIFENGAILDEIITSGYPRVRMIEENPLLFHSGHVNGWTHPRNTWERSGIISAAVAPGSSGGPVINSRGAVVGVVEKEIETRHESGDSSYNAMIPFQVLAEEIANGRHCQESMRLFIEANANV